MNSGLIHTYYYYNIGSKQGNKTTCNKVWVHRLGAHARLSNTRGAVEDVDTMISNMHFRCFGKLIMNEEI